MQTKKIVVASIFLLLMITLGIVFRPLPPATPDNTLRTQGTIEQVLETQNKNVVFKLKDDDRFYYIQDDLEKERSFRELQRELSGKPVEIYYVKHWTAVDPLRVKHVTKVHLNKLTLYSSN
ncbi:hypothetical protein [Chryseolinea sp. H1M3-3]|jgi:hypothetical protein|uniref:hypothetical protein n=1 Tax=Chryseolinea sp. H1M3-3 TaxID=3034144 RepID=UPI0023ECD821|nr:hypothetical protein [Chryseolinea sp. H1M3-3]